MMKVTQKDIRGLVKEGVAASVTKPEQIPCPYQTIGVSVGRYGINGRLLYGENGKLYAVEDRNFGF